MTDKDDLEKRIERALKEAQAEIDNTLPPSIEQDVSPQSQKSISEWAWRMADQTMPCGDDYELTDEEREEQERKYEQEQALRREQSQRESKIHQRRMLVLGIVACWLFVTLLFYLSDGGGVKEYVYVLSIYGVMFGVLVLGAYIIHWCNGWD